LFLFAIPQEKLCFSFDLQGFLLLAAASGDSLLRRFGSLYRNRNLSSKSNFGLPPSGYCSVWNISNETGTPLHARFADLLAWNEIIDSRRIKTAFAIFYLIRDAAAENLSRCALAAQDTPQAFGELLG